MFITIKTAHKTFNNSCISDDKYGSQNRRKVWSLPSPMGSIGKLLVGLWDLDF